MSPTGAIVEVGATVDGDGIHPDVMPALGEPLAGWTATQIELQDLLVEATVDRRQGPGAPGAARGPAVTDRRGGVPGHVRRAVRAAGRPAPVLITAAAEAPDLRSRLRRAS